MLKCPRCTGNCEPTGKEWEYGQFHVKHYKCAVCKKSFKAYYKGGKLTHTIPKIKSP